MKLSLVVVAHRSSSVLPEALHSFRREAGSLGLSAEIVVVEQSEDARELAAVEGLGAERVIAATNRGYAAGLNTGVGEASGDVVLLANPDIVWLAGSLGPMLRALSEGADIIGPQFELGGCLFPPADPMTPLDELRRLRASRRRGAWERFVKSELERSLRVWRARGAVRVSSLSGALLLTRREVLERVGAWNEDYFLYFEETDWLRRAGRLGMRCAVASEARVVHAWGHAADPRADSSRERFERARRLFYRSHFGLLGRFTAAAAKLPPGPPFSTPRWETSGSGSGRESRDADHLRLLSPSPLGFPLALVEAGADSPERIVSRIAEATGRRTPLLYMTCHRETKALFGPWIVDPVP